MDYWLLYLRDSEDVTSRILTNMSDMEADNECSSSSFDGACDSGSFDMSLMSNLDFVDEDKQHWFAPSFFAGSLSDWNTGTWCDDPFSEGVTCPSLLAGEEQLESLLISWKTAEGENLCTTMDTWNKRFMGEAEAHAELHERGDVGKKENYLYFRENDKLDGQGRRVVFWSYNGSIRFNPKRPKHFCAGRIQEAFVKKEIVDFAGTPYLAIHKDHAINLAVWAEVTQMYSLADALAMRHIWVES